MSTEDVACRLYQSTVGWGSPAARHNKSSLSPWNK